MSIEKFYILKNSATKDNCADCRSIANQVYQGSKLPKLPIHPNCACSFKEIPTLVLPTPLITSAKEKTEYDGSTVKFPDKDGRVWYKSVLNNDNPNVYIVFSSDGLAFHTIDGGKTFKKLLITSDTHQFLMNLPTMLNGDAAEFGKFSDINKIIENIGETEIIRGGDILDYSKEIIFQMLLDDTELRLNLIREMQKTNSSDNSDNKSFRYQVKNVSVQIAMDLLMHLTRMLPGNSSYTYENYDYNSQFKFDGYIYTQYTGEASNLKMGFYTADNNGCAWVSTYNLCVMLRPKYEQPAEIIQFFEKNGGLLVYGKYGAQPGAVVSYLKSQGHSVSVHNMPEEVDSLMRRPCILVYAHDTGAHYVAVKYDHEEECYYVYNGPNRDEAEQKKSIDEWMKERKATVISVISVDIFGHN